MNFFLLIVLVLLNISAARANDSTFQGQKLPSAEVKTLEGNTVDILKYIDTGKTTVIFFWETFCKPSIKALDNILDLYDDWQTKYKCNFLAVSMDDARNSSKIKPFVDGRGWPYFILTDENKTLARAVNIDSCPYILILNSKSQIIYRHLGYVEGMEYEIEQILKNNL